MGYTGYQLTEAQQIPQDPEPCIGSSFAEGALAGLALAVDLTRSGATVDELAALLDDDPAEADPAKYQERLAGLRKLLDANFLGTKGKKATNETSV